MGDNRNFLIAILLSVLVFVGWQHFVVTPRMEAEKARQAQTQPTQSQATGANGAKLPEVQGGPASVPSSGATIAAMQLTRDEALKQSPRVAINSDEVDGSISLKGARIDDLHLRKYRETVDKTSPEITLLSPAAATSPISPNSAMSRRRARRRNFPRATRPGRSRRASSSRRRRR